MSHIRSAGAAVFMALTVLCGPRGFASSSVDDGGMTEAKSLYASGRYIEALGKFTTLLRSDPHNDEARQYLRLIVDNMKKPASVSKHAKPPMPVSALPDDLKRRLIRRQLLAIDLATLPHVRIVQRDNGAEAQLPSNFLFNDKQAGLKEQGIPLLDRVAAWLRTFDQPIIIHCYPEELDDPAKNGRLFLKRFAELYSFFTEEKKLNAGRFISSEDLEVNQTPDAEEVANAPKGAWVVIEVVGVDYSYPDEGMPGGQPSTPWLENSLTIKPPAFSPLEGESSIIDLAAIARMGVRKWDFSITPETSPDKSYLSLSGAGNVLQRIRWDGRDSAGMFVKPGTYVARLNATNNEGHVLSKEVQLMVTHGPGATAPAPVARRTAKKPKKHLPVVAKPPVEKETSATDEAATPAAEKTPAASPPADETAASSESTPAADTEDSTHAIWKQVIQFDPNESNIKASIRASLERIGKTLEVYPLQKVRIVGFAGADENGPEALAKKRAETIRAILIEEYRVDAARVILAAGKIGNGTEASKVELSITN